jgi:hypothetical protein
MKLHKPSIAVALAVLLAACGDSPSNAPEDTPPQASDEVPAAALASASAWTQWAASLPPSEADNAKKLQAVMPPTSETEAPLPL